MDDQPLQLEVDSIIAWAVHQECVRCGHLQTQFKYQNAVQQRARRPFEAAKNPNSRNFKL